MITSEDQVVRICLGSGYFLGTLIYIAEEYKGEDEFGNNVLEVSAARFKKFKDENYLRESIDEHLGIEIKYLMIGESVIRQFWNTQDEYVDWRHKTKDWW